MNKLIILLFAILLPMIGTCQVKKKIGFIPYTDPDNAEKEYRDLTYKNIYDAALRVFVNTQRFDVLDRGSFNIIKIEKEFQKGEDLANVEIIEQGKVAAAQLLAVAKLSTFTITDSDDGEGYSIYITAEFKQIDVKTGKATSAYQLQAQVLDKQENFGLKNNNRITTVEEAISKAVVKMEKDLETWIKRSFPMILKIIDVDTENMTLIVEGGRNEGLTTKFDMKAVTIKTYGEKILTRDAGKLSFLPEEGVGEDLTILKMKSKKDWQKFLELWTKNSDNLFVTEDID